MQVLRSKFYEASSTKQPGKSTKIGAAGRYSHGSPDSLYQYAHSLTFSTETTRTTSTQISNYRMLKQR